MKYFSTGNVGKDGVRRYWGTPEDVARCTAGVGAWGAPQCSRRRGHGRDGLFCVQHARLASAPASGTRTSKEEA